jgi:hypothetical protein
VLAVDLLKHRDHYFEDFKLVILAEVMFMVESERLPGVFAIFLEFGLRNLFFDNPLHKLYSLRGICLLAALSRLVAD